VHKLTCLGCERIADACLDCGWEYRGSGETCVSCTLVAIAEQRSPDDAREKNVALTVFNAPDGVSDDDLRRAEEEAAAMLGRYTGYKVFRSAVEEAHQRAAALARLEAQLRGLTPPSDAA